MVTKAIKTTYDGFIVVRYESGRVESFEGLLLCPANVRRYLKAHKPEEVDCFCMEAIAYGYI